MFLLICYVLFAFTPGVPSLHVGEVEVAGFLFQVVYNVRGKGVIAFAWSGPPGTRNFIDRPRDNWPADPPKKKKIPEAKFFERRQ